VAPPPSPMKHTAVHCLVWLGLSGAVSVGLQDSGVLVGSWQGCAGSCVEGWIYLGCSCFAGQVLSPAVFCAGGWCRCVAVNACWQGGVDGRVGLCWFSLGFASWVVLSLRGKECEVATTSSGEWVVVVRVGRVGWSASWAVSCSVRALGHSLHGVYQYAV
jgi:hypothetical protein